MYVIIDYVAYYLSAVSLSLFLAFEEANGHDGNPKYQRPVSSV